MSTRIPGPSVTKLAEVLHLPQEQARVLKDLMDGVLNSKRVMADLGMKEDMYADRVQNILAIADKILDGSGVEYIASAQDDQYETHGVEYVNMGDTYDATLIFDAGKYKFVVGSWGDIVEREPRRFE